MILRIFWMNALLLLFAAAPVIIMVFVDRNFLSAENSTQISTIFAAALLIFVFFNIFVVSRFAKKKECINEKLVTGINDVVNALIDDNSRDFHTLIKSLEILGKTLNVDRVQLWQNEVVNGELNFILKHRWNSKFDPCPNSIPIGLAFVYKSMPLWEEKFSNGICINSPFTKLSPEEKKFLDNFKIESIVMIPVFQQKKFWGFLRIDDCKREIYFRDTEIKMLQAVGLMLCNTLNRNILEIERYRYEQLLKAVTSATTIILETKEDIQVLFKKSMDIIGPCIEADRINIWRNELIDGDLYYVNIASWLSHRISGITNVTQKRKYSENIPLMERCLNNECLNSPVAAMAPQEMQILQQQGVKSCLTIPIYNGDTCYGFFSIDDFKSEECFSTSEIDILRSASIMLVNVIERREKDIAISQTYERVQIIVDTAPFGCIFWDQDFNITFSNEACVNLFGVKDKQDFIDSFYNLSPKYQPDGKLSTEAVYECLSRCVKEGSSVFEWMHQTKNGELFPTEIYLKSAVYGTDQIVICYLRDLRQHKQMMKEIEIGDEMLKTVNESATSLFQSESKSFKKNLLYCMEKLANVTDVDRVHIFKNSHKEDGTIYAAQLYEWLRNSDKFKKSSYDEDFSIDKNVLPAWFEKLPRGSSINSIVAYLTEPERTFLQGQGVMSVLAVPIFLQDEFWGFAGFYDCRNERIFPQTAISILRSAGLLFATAISHNVMTENLHTAMQAAQDASRAKSNFLSNMSHEIRTPMNAIIGMTTLGKSAATIEKKNYSFDKVESASKHLLNIINDILEMSKIESGKYELVILEFDFENLIRKAVDFVSYKISEKRQKFTVYMDKEIPNFLIGDEQRLLQVIINLLSNATKFTPENEFVHFGVYLENAENNFYSLRFTVKDNGIGISAEQQEHLFKSFTQAENSTTRKFGGTGLGLAISKHIIELMGGEIWIESELGKGAAFIFKLKLERGVKQSANLLPDEIDRLNVRVIMVDDDPDTLDSFSNIAEQLGISYDIAKNGEEAIQKIENSEPYHLAFVDYKMEGMNGIELCEKIKELDNGPPVKIMVSSADWNEIASDAKDAEIDHFISKPFFASTIANSITRFLGKNAKKSMEKEIPQTKSFEGATILLAEDVEINREIVIAMLEDTGIEIDCAENGQIALELFEKNPDRYKMIFMDMRMPVMDGLEATVCIRSLDLEAAKQIPIIAMTAHVFKEDIDKCIAIGMNDHIGKPLEMRELTNIISKYLA